MKDFDFKYADENVSSREIFMLIPSIVIGVGVLTLPRTLTQTVPFSDGWIAIVIGSVVASIFAWVIMKLTLRFPGQQFYDFCTAIATKPIAIILTLLYALHFGIFASYEARMIANISKQYILDRTPVEIIALVFVILVGYAVSGSRAAILRLNMMFFPIVVFILFITLLFNIPYIELDRLKPFFQASWKDILSATKESIFSFLGYEALLFYMYLLERKEMSKVSKYAFIGMGIISILYLLVFVVSITVFTIPATQQIMYPTVELAKEVNVPGGLIERIDPLFFTVWVMTIFNTAAMSLDITVMGIQSIFNIKKQYIVFMALPIIYFMSMIPQNHIQLAKIGSTIGYSGTILSAVIPTVLLIIAHFRGVSGK